MTRSRRWFPAKWWIALLPAPLLLLAACTTSVETPASDSRDTVAVSGQGVVSAAPDTAIVVVGVSVLRETVTDAQRDAGAAMDSVLEAVQDEGVDEDDIATVQFSVFPEFDFTRDNERELRGFRVVNRAQIKVRDIDRAGDVIDQAVEAGSDDVVIDSLSFTIDDTTALADQAREQAIEDAERKAEQLADLGDIDLGPITTITESGGPLPPPVDFAAERAIAADAAGFGGTPIVGGEFSVTVTVFVTYAIE